MQALTEKNRLLMEERKGNGGNGGRSVSDETNHITLCLGARLQSTKIAKEDDTLSDVYEISCYLFAKWGFFSIGIEKVSYRNEGEIERTQYWWKNQMCKIMASGHFQLTKCRTDASRFDLMLLPIYSEFSFFSVCTILTRCSSFLYS